jgi:hypothetical protein
MAAGAVVMLVRVSIRVMVRVIVTVRMIMIVRVILIVAVVMVMMCGMGTPCAFVEHPGPDPHDRQAGNRAQRLRHFRRDDVLKQKKRDQTKHENCHGVREGHHRAQEGCMFEGAARPYQIRCDDGFAVPGSERVSGAKDKREPHCRRDHPGGEFLLVEELRQSVWLTQTRTLEPKEKQIHARAYLAF